jgi:ATP-dependent Clp protease ATP-binding subunit ClpC
MTDGKGRTVNFKNTIIIATSNIGSEKILNFIGSSTAKPANTKSKDDSEKMIKFKDSDDDKDKDSQSWDDLKDDVLEVLKKMFRPEFLNRIDEIIVFKALSDKQLSSIVRLLLERTKLLLNSQKISIDIDDAAINQLVAQGYDPQYGARPIRRTIQREIENPLSNKLIAGDLQQGDSITISFNGSKFVFEKQNQ